MIRNSCWFRLLSCIYLLLGIVTSSFGQTALIHAHRGGAGEYPENTLAAMLHAVSQGVRVLELDVHITADSLVVVSHDSYINSSKALNAKGKRLSWFSQWNRVLYHMPYAKISTYDVGSLASSKFPQRENLACQIPLLDELIRAVEEYTQEEELPAVSYNIEIKTHWFKDNRLSPPYQVFTDLVLAVLQTWDLGERLIIQSFDPRTLNYLHAQYPELTLSYLVKKRRTPLTKLLKKLHFTPEILSPHYKMVNQEFVKEAHRKGMQVVPWTVDQSAAVLQLARWGVDGIITNYPTKALQWLKED